MASSAVSATSNPDAKPIRILLIDDQPLLLEQLARRLRQNNRCEVTTCVDSRKAPALVDTTPFDAVVTDLDMPLLDGRKLLELLVAAHPELPIVVLTGNNDVLTAVACMRAGAMDFLTKPVTAEHLLAVLERVAQQRALTQEAQQLGQRLLQPGLATPLAFDGIVTADPLMRAIFQYLEVIAPSTHPVLVTGETGTGKELIARAVQRLSRPGKPFVAVNVAGLDDTVFADTLFGHKKGAFTGAESARAGLIEGAAGGTLFLDEIGDLSLISQVKLLRLLQEREYMPLGMDQPKHSDARVVVATCRTMEELRDPSRFRKDLYYRLKAHHVHLPPLRDRAQDIPLLAGHFLSETCEELELPAASFAPDALATLTQFEFPGNIRELQSVIRDVVSRCRGGVIPHDQLQRALGSGATPAGAGPERVQPGILGTSLGIPAEFPTLKAAADQLVAEALRRSQGNHTMAARMLGLTRQGLYNRLRAGGDDKTGETT